MKLSMQMKQISWDVERGTLTESGIRYVLMRPDVVMGTTAHVDDPQGFVRAMGESAFEHSRGSFQVYRESGALDDADPLDHGCATAGQLGWGVWQVVERSPSGYIIRVSNSPFALGKIRKDLPMCGWIVGVLRAIMAVRGDTTALVNEACCAAQGHDHCEFRIALTQD